MRPLAQMSCQQRGGGELVLEVGRVKSETGSRSAEGDRVRISAKRTLDADHRPHAYGSAGGLKPEEHIPPADASRRAALFLFFQMRGAHKSGNTRTSEFSVCASVHTSA